MKRTKKKKSKVELRKIETESEQDFINAQVKTLSLSKQFQHRNVWFLSLYNKVGGDNLRAVNFQCVTTADTGGSLTNC